MTTLNAHPEPEGDSDSLIKSHAASNAALASAYHNYVISRGFAAATVATYTETVNRFVEGLNSVSAVGAERAEIRTFLSGLLDRGASSNTIRKQTFALRSFFRFLQLSRLTRHNPTTMLSQRKVPRRIPRVLSIAEVERLIAAAKNPTEAAVVEFLYATGVRVSELVAVRLENIDFTQEPCVAHVKKGKGGKDRTVLFGRTADAAVRAMLVWRPNQSGYLFERPAQRGCLSLKRIRGLMVWIGGYYDAAGVQQSIYIGRSAPIYRVEGYSKSEAREKFDALLKDIPGVKCKPPGPYTDRAVRLMISRMGVRAGIGRVYPHSLRRAFATHLLEGGADLRVIQDLLGHERVTTTCLYASLSATNLKAIHTKCHPTGGNEDVQQKENA